MKKLIQKIGGLFAAAATDDGGPVVPAANAPQAVPDIGDIGRFYEACITGNIDEIKDYAKKFPHYLGVHCPTEAYPHLSGVICFTALSTAVLHDQPAAVTALLDAGVDVDCTNMFTRQTPLMTAAQCDARDCFDILMARGANVFAVDEQGRNATLYADGSVEDEDVAGYGSPICLEKLKRRMAEIQAKEEWQQKAPKRAEKACMTDQRIEKPAVKKISFKS